MVKVLVNENLDKPDIYLSGDEQQYLITKLYKESISEEFSAISNCPECGEENDFQVSVDEVSHYRPGTYPKHIDYLGGIDFVDIGTVKELEKTIEAVMKDQRYDGVSEESDIELALHIRFMSAKDIIENLEIMDSISIKDLKYVLDTHKEIAPEFKMNVNRVCKHCGKEVNFVIGDIPDVFESLLS